MKGRGWAWVLMGAVAMLATPAIASADDDHGWRDRDDRAYRRSGRYSGEAYRRGMDRGYEEGVKHGEKDAKRGRDFNFRHEDEYRDADEGYRSHYGSRVEYSRAFRRGYEEGYRDGYRAYRNSRNGHGRYGRDDRDGDYRYEDIYDWQSNGRHRHRARSGWCDDDHGYRGGYTTREIPRRW